MALTISTGFVVDDAIVVIENITPLPGAGQGSARSGARGRAGNRLHRVVDEPLAGGGVHSAAAHERHRRTSVPRVRGHDGGGDRDLHGGLADRHADDVRASPQRSRSVTAACTSGANACSRPSSSAYGRTLDVVLRYAVVTLLILIGTIGLTGYLFLHVPKGFFPQQDTGRIERSRFKPIRTARFSR